MFEFGFANMRFEQNKLSNLDVCSNLEIFNSENNLQCREIIAPNHFPLFDLDDEKFNQQMYKSEINEVDASLNKKDECIQTELQYNDDNDIFKKNEVKTQNKECVKIEKDKEHSTSLCASGDNITNAQFENPENLIPKINDSDINEDINYHNPKDSLEYIKELIVRKKFKGTDKQRRFGRNDDRELFEILKVLCELHQRNIDDFLTNQFETDITLKKILIEAHQRTNFRGGKVYLLKRIQKLVSTQTFSVRENKLLKKLVTKQLESNNIDFVQIEYFFPGKQSEVVRREIGKLMLQL